LLTKSANVRTRWRRYSAAASRHDRGQPPSSAQMSRPVTSAIRSATGSAQWRVRQSGSEWRIEIQPRTVSAAGASSRGPALLSLRPKDGNFCHAREVGEEKVAGVSSLLEVV